MRLKTKMYDFFCKISRNVKKSKDRKNGQKVVKKLSKVVKNLLKRLLSC
jgi:hypothetical protein